MDRPLRLGSLFDGSGGFPLGGLLCGVEPVWASEIEPFPIRVTTKRFPWMQHLGDISRVNGAEIPPVDIITFGSPCTDLSIAGRRDGLGGKQSSLFFQALRIIKEMREASDGIYPRWIVWENVPGAFSSNGGADFGQVLTEIARIAEPEAPVVRTADKAAWPGAGLLRKRQILKYSRDKTAALLKRAARKKGIATVYIATARRRSKASNFPGRYPAADAPIRT